MPDWNARGIPLPPLAWELIENEPRRRWHFTCLVSGVNVNPLQAGSVSPSNVAGKASPSSPGGLFLRMILESSPYGADHAPVAASPQKPFAPSPSRAGPAELQANKFLLSGEGPVAILHLQNGEPDQLRPEPKKKSSNWRLDPFELPIPMVPSALPLPLALQLTALPIHTPNAAGDGKKAAVSGGETPHSEDKQVAARSGSEGSDAVTAGDLAFTAELRVADERSAASGVASRQPVKPPENSTSASPRSADSGPVTTQDNSTLQPPDGGGPAVDHNTKQAGPSQDGGPNGQNAERQAIEAATAIRPDKATPTNAAGEKPPSVTFGQANVVAFSASAGQSAAGGAKAKTEQTQTSAPPPSADDVAAPQTEPGSSTHQLALHLDHENMPGVSLQLVERDGTIRVAVRTPDAELNGRMQANLNDLVNSLKQGGVEADAWAPAPNTATGHPNTGSSDSRDPAGQFGDPNQPGRRNGGRRERRQRDATPNEISFASQFPL